MTSGSVRLFSYSGRTTANRGTMNPIFTRTARLIGSAGVSLLQTKTVAVLGLGGVGSFTAEALVRAGIGHLIFIDGDVVDMTNLNRQLVANLTTVGRPKAEVAAERARRIDPDVDVRPLVSFLRPDDDHFIETLEADFIIDAIDDIPAKIAIAKTCRRLAIPEAAAMGTGNRLHPELLEIADISKTSVCPLARKVRRLLRAEGITHLPVVYSKEIPQKPEGEGHAPGSISFVPPVAGMILAGMAVRHFLEENT